MELFGLPVMMQRININPNPIAVCDVSLQFLRNWSSRILSRVKKIGQSKTPSYLLGAVSDDMVSRLLHNTIAINRIAIRFFFHISYKFLMRVIFNLINNHILPLLIKRYETGIPSRNAHR